MGIEHNGGYVSVLDFGARPNSFEDDTQAFQEAIRDGRSVYIPAGVYYIHEPLMLINQNFIGAGIFATQILSTCTDEKQPVLYAGRSCVIADLTIGYKPCMITDHEGEGDRVGIFTVGDMFCLQRGSTIRNVRIEECGTAIRSDDSFGVMGGPFNVLFESLEIIGFTFRGIDFASANRSGNVFSNLYLCSDKPCVDAMIQLRGEDCECLFQQVNLEHTHCRVAIRFYQVYAFHFLTLHVQDVQLKEGGNVIELHNSCGRIDELTLYYMPIYKTHTSLFWIGNATYDMKLPGVVCRETVNKLKIGTLHVKGMNDPTFRAEGMPAGMFENDRLQFQYFYRPQDATGQYMVELDSYVWFTFKDDASFYRRMPRDPYGRITFLKLGELPRAGTTAQRPIYRLCPYTTTYFDTDLNRLVVFDGKEWR